MWHSVLMLTAILDAGAAALDVIFPRSCAGCGRGDTPLCPPCAQTLTEVAWSEPPALSRLLVEKGSTAQLPFPVRIASLYEGTARAIITHWKNTEDTALDRAIGAQLARALPRLATALPELEHIPRPFSIVPAPCSAERRKADRVVTAIIASALAQYLDAPVHDVMIYPARHRLRAFTMSDRTRKARGIVMGGPCSPRAIICDDVVTTGATLAGTAHALAENGVKVVAAVALASVPYSLK